jgi:hypothetical protein
MKRSIWAFRPIYVRMANLDFEVADGKTFRDLCKEIIDRSQSKKDQLDTLVSDVRTHIKTANDVAVFLPRVKELLEVGIKNDDQVVKLVSILQKLQSTQLETTGGEDGMLTEDEKEQLLKAAAKSEVKEIKKAVEASDIPKA